ncbi:hypothetical protein CYY_001095 [Polysphondylium violaceum]|uniref:RNA helicase n=1 Tax=Polysphondylium violaceum TaxID=133409 RepID=A0A8J4Q2L9_9MYCE|nr:hypothetical protein CYY_001095 [Polysphondylium violaceum]
MTSNTNNSNYSNGNTNISSLLDRDGGDTNSGNVDFIFNSNQRLSITQQRIALPIYQYRKHLLYLLETNQTVVVVGNTGCGKTTQIPQYLHESGWTDGYRTIAITQPRRVAAISVASRVATEMNEELGHTVGYSVRFDEKVSAEHTRIKYMTDGMLIREMMLDPLLSKYPVVMIDEAHERSLATDVLLGLVKKVQGRRKDLKIIISSATMDAELFKQFFNNNITNDKSKDTAAIISIEGTNYPVDVHYLEQPTLNYLDTTLNTVIDIHNLQPPGDILVFLTGQEEIDKMVSSIQDRVDAQQQQQKGNKMKVNVLPMYSGLSINKQIRVFEKSGDPRKIRKIVVATNIAETSITIDGIVYVVDSGFVKIKSYNPTSGLESLVVVPTSQSSADQRAGRAGRNRAGKCYRLYTQDAFTKLPVHSIPEIQRSNLAPIILQLKALGIDNILHFDFISPAPTISLVRALEVLYGLGALNDNGQLTQPTGHIMAEFPVDPSFSKMIIQSEVLGCSKEVLSIAAMLNVQGIFTNHNHKARREFIVKEGDHLSLLNIYNAYTSKSSNGKTSAGPWCHEHQINHKAMQRVVQVRKQLEAYCHKYSIKVVSCLTNAAIKDATIPIRKSIISGFFTNAAHLQPDGSYMTIRDKHKLFMHPTSVLCSLANSPEWVLFHDVTITTKEYMKDITIIDPKWLYEMAPHFYVYEK